MKAMLAPWWRDRSPREQWLVLIAAGLAAVVLIWLALLRPLADARSAAQARHDRAITGLAQVAVTGERIRTAQARGVGSAAVPLVELISERSRTAGLTVENLGATGDGQVSLRIAAVKPPALLRWIAEIETRDGVVIDRASIVRNQDSSVAVDLALRRSR